MQMESGTRDEKGLSPEETSRREFMLTAGKLAVYTAPAVMLLMRPAKDAIAASTGIPNQPEGPEAPEDSWHPGNPGTSESGPSSNDGPSDSGTSNLGSTNTGPSNAGSGGSDLPFDDSENSGNSNGGNSNSRRRKPWFWRWLSFWD
jgi:hypothetical protein